MNLRLSTLLPLVWLVHLISATAVAQSSLDRSHGLHAGLDAESCPTRAQMKDPLPLPRDVASRLPCHHIRSWTAWTRQLSTKQPLIGPSAEAHWRRPAQPTSRAILTEKPAWEECFARLTALRTDTAATAVALVRRQESITLLAVGDAAGDLLLATTSGVVLAEWSSGAGLFWMVNMGAGLAAFCRQVTAG